MSDIHTNPTQVAGVVAFAVAAASCALAGRRLRGPWPALAAAQLLCLLEIAWGARHRLHALADAFLQTRSEYASRVPLQQALLATVLLAAAAGGVMTLRLSRRDADAANATAATGVTLALFVVEAISLHRIDTLMYRAVGPLLAIALAWCAAAAVVTASAWRASRRARA